MAACEMRMRGGYFDVVHEDGQTRHTCLSEAKCESFEWVQVPQVLDLRAEKLPMQSLMLHRSITRSTRLRRHGIYI